MTRVLQANYYDYNVCVLQVMTASALQRRLQGTSITISSAEPGNVRPLQLNYMFLGLTLPLDRVGRLACK